jgi:hypothetical protein
MDVANAPSARDLLGRGATELGATWQKMRRCRYCTADIARPAACAADTIARGTCHARRGPKCSNSKCHRGGGTAQRRSRAPAKMGAGSERRSRIEKRASRENTLQAVSAVLLPFGVMKPNCASRFDATFSFVAFSTFNNRTASIGQPSRQQPATAGHDITAQPAQMWLGP